MEEQTAVEEFDVRGEVVGLRAGAAVHRLHSLESTQRDKAT